MPIKIPSDLPAREILNRENIFIMDERRAVSQDIRPLKLVILNLMPKKTETETQLLRLIGNTPLQIEFDLMDMASHTSKNTSSKHLLEFYKSFDALKQNQYDAMIVTGAPVELLPFEEVDYWQELCQVMDWSKTNVFSTLYICWGAQAALHHQYGIQKHLLPQKMFGVFEHTLADPSHNLLYGFDDVFYAPHSRHTTVYEEDIRNHPDLQVLSTSPQAGLYLAASRDNRDFFVTGHSEYDRETLADEYTRDIAKNLPIQTPVNYFKNNDPAQGPLVRWRAHSNMLFSNWINYYVYQETPYDFIAR